MQKPTTFRMGIWWRVKHYAPKVLRLSAFLTCVYLAVLLVVGHNARAQVGETLFGIGEEMLRYEGAHRIDAPRTLMLNGQPIRLASGVTRHGLTRVLDWYEARCQEHDGELGEQLREITEGTPEMREIDSSLIDATLREEEGGKGYVACLDTGRERLGPGDILARFEKFRVALDVSELGDLRYIYAEENAEGTFFVAFWTQGSFKIAEMFPGQGDVPGNDVDGVPRPPDGRRILSAWEDGRPQSVTMYGESRKGPDELERWYRVRMPDEGWRLLELDDAMLARTGRERVPHLLVWERGEDEMATLWFGRDDHDLGVTSVLVSR